MNSLRLKGSQAFCGDPSANEYRGELIRSNRLWNVKKMRRCDDVLQFRLNMKLFFLSHSSDSGYPEFRFTLTSPRFLIARPPKSKEQFLTNLAEQNYMISLTNVKKISPRGMLVVKVAVW
jgi:hypothetical protein